MYKYYGGQGLREKLVSSIRIISGLPQRNAEHHREWKLTEIGSAGVVSSKYPMAKLLFARDKAKAAQAEHALGLRQCQ